MLHVGLDLSRTRLDVHAMDQTGTSIAVTTTAPDAGGLASLAYRLGGVGQPITAGVESTERGPVLPQPPEAGGWAGGDSAAGEGEGFGPPGSANRKTGCLASAG